MSRCPPLNQISRVLVACLLVSPSVSCSSQDSLNSQVQLLDHQVARRALEKSLDEWRSAPPIDRTLPSPRLVLFSDQQRQPGQRLRAYEILGDTEFEGCRRFLVRLMLEAPEETLVAHYYVFGRDAIWVYRGEDFDMLMHMDQRMTAVPSRASSPMKSEDRRGP